MSYVAVSMCSVNVCANCSWCRCKVYTYIVDVNSRCSLHDVMCMVYLIEPLFSDCVDFFLSCFCCANQNNSDMLSVITRFLYLTHSHYTSDLTLHITLHSTLHTACCTWQCPRTVRASSPARGTKRCVFGTFFQVLEARQDSTSVPAR